MTTKKTVALITGANKGIGVEIARQLGKKGLTVVIGSRDVEKGVAVANTLKAEGIDAHAVRLDVTRQADIDALPKYFESTFGGLDVLVNNAGVAPWGTDDLAAFKSTLEANVTGAVAVTYALLPLLKASPAGRIVNQSSVLGSLGSIQQNPAQFGDFINIAYTTSKASLNGFTVALAHTLRGSKLKVNAAHPGWVKTDLGGEGAPLTTDVGAETAVTLATLPPDGPNGGFFHRGDTLPW